MNRTRIGWLPGSDRLRGICHCGAEIEAEDPVLLWDWLSGHPVHPLFGANIPELPVAPAPPHLVRDPALIRRRQTTPA